MLFTEARVRPGPTVPGIVVVLGVLLSFLSLTRASHAEEIDQKLIKQSRAESDTGGAGTAFASELTYHVDYLRLRSLASGAIAVATMTWRTHAQASKCQATAETRLAVRGW